MELKRPPCSIESEHALIAGVLDNPQSFHDVNGLVTESDFYHKAHGLIWRVMDSMAMRSLPIDPVSLVDSLNSAGHLENIGGPEYIVDIASSGRGSANSKHYAKTIKEKRMARDLITIGRDISESGYESGDIAEKIEQAQRAVMSVQAFQASDPQHIGKVLADTVRSIDEATKAKDGIVGIPTGFIDLDNRMGGMMKEDLIIVAGRPSMGKSVFAMNIAEHAAMNDKTVLVFSLEMSNHQLAKRSLSSVGRVDFNTVRTGQGGDAMYQGISAGMIKLKDRSLYLDDNAMITSHQLGSRARKLAQQIGKPIDLIVVDYLQLLNDKGDGTERITKMSRALKLAAKDLKCPIVCLSQLNRSCEQRDNKRPKMSDLRESGAIEQDADAIIMLYRDEVYDENTNQKGVGEAILRKLRNGEIGTVYLKSNLHQMRFDNLQNYTPPPEPMRKRSRGGLD